MNFFHRLYLELFSILEELYLIKFVETKPCSVFEVLIKIASSLSKKFDL